MWQEGWLCRTVPAAANPEALVLLWLLWVGHRAEMSTAMPGGLLAISLQKYFYTKVF